MFKKRIKIFGKSMPLGIIFLALTVIAASAALLYVILSFGLTGSVQPGMASPTISNSFTNDDGTENVIFAMPNDDGDLGPDPSGPWVDGGGTPRQTFDEASCYITDDGLTTVDVVINNAYQLDLPGSGSWCSIVFRVENVHDDPIYFLGATSDGVFDILPNTHADIGQVIPVVDAVWQVFDLHLKDDVPPGPLAPATIDFAWSVTAP